MTDPTRSTRRMPGDLSGPESRANVDSFFRIALVVIPTIVVIALISFGIYWMTQTGHVPVSPPMWGIAAGAILGAVVLLALLALLKHLFSGASAAGVSIGVPKKGGFFMQVITSLLVAALLFAVLYPLNPTAPLWTDGEGYFHIAMYALAIIVSIMIATHLVGFARFSAVAIILIVFAILGPRTLVLYDPEGVVLAKLHLPTWSNSSTTPVFSTFTQCGMEIPKPVVVSASQTLISTGVKCQFDFNVLNGKVRLEGKNSSGVSGYADFGPSGLIANYTPPGWRAFTIQSLESGTKITARFS